MPSSRRRLPLLVAVVSAAPLVFATSVSATPAGSPAPAPTPSPTGSPSPSPTPTATPTATSTPTDSVTQLVVTRSNYAPNPADTVRTFAPRGDGPYPAVLFIHGGAWGRSRPNSDEFRFARSLAATQSWVVAVIGYPTKIPHERIVEPHAIRMALTHLAARSDVDRHSIALWGESSGGQLALLTAYRDAMRPDPLVRAVVSISGPTNMRTEYYSLAETALGAVLRFEGLSPRAARARGSARYRDTSPVSIVRPRDPATFQAISRHDPLVPPQQVNQLSRLLSRAGVAHVTVHIPGDGHSTTIETQRPEGFDHDVKYLAASFLAAIFATSD